MDKSILSENERVILGSVMIIDDQLQRIEMRTSRDQSGWI